jgi:pyridoxal phosphate enzyme (YggS family)
VLPRSIKWHFIGGLQSNKCKPLAEQIPNLWCVSSVDSAKKADQLEKGRAALVVRVEEGGGRFGEGGEFESRLRVMVQVNTSGEEAKSGVEPGEALELCRYIRERCPHLKLSGLMTIGAIARSKATTPEDENEDFVCLRETRDRVAEALGIAKEELELSMGMSSDFEGAIALGSNEVRIGSTIFGERLPKKDAKVKDHTEGGQG